MYPCNDRGRQESRTSDDDECGGYAAEAGCLAGSIGRCKDADCKDRVRRQLFDALLQACNTYGCKGGQSPYKQWIANVLTEQQRRVVELACGKPGRVPGTSDPPVPPPGRNEPKP
jgi:hypothetical protein